jgi:GT2 family glycosyltransferase
VDINGNGSKEHFEINSKFPLIYLTLPFGNSIKTIKKTLATILNLDYPRNRIILHFIGDRSDNGSVPTVRARMEHESVKDYRDIKHSITSWTDTDRNIARVRNIGLQGMKRSKADFWFSVDSDVAIPVFALKYMAEIMLKYPEIAVVYLPYAYHLRDMDKPLGTFDVDVVLGCTLVRREALEDIDFMLDERYANTDDVWLDSILQTKGWLTYSVEDFRCLHLKPKPPIGYFLRHFTERPQLDRRLMKDKIAPKSMYNRYIYYSSIWGQIILFIISLFLPLLFTLTAIAFLLLGLLIGVWRHGIRFPITSLPRGLALVVGMLYIRLKELRGNTT